MRLINTSRRGARHCCHHSPDSPEPAGATAWVRKQPNELVVAAGLEPATLSYAPFAPIIAFDILEAAMDKSQMIVLAVANLPTMITVLIGILLNNGRITDLNSRMASIENRMTNLEHKFDTRFELLLSKVVDVDNRLTRIEAQRH